MASLSENIRKTLNDYDEKILDIYNQIENLPSDPGGGSGVEENEYGGIEINDDNQAISDNAFSFGFGNIAGGKGFKITACSDNGDGTGTYTLSSVDGLVADGSMTYNVRLSTASYNVGVITAINGNVVTVTNYPNIALETDADEPKNFNIENYLTITGRPDLGDTDIGFNSFAGGQGNVAQDKNTFSFGKGNKVIGQFGASLGRDNVSGYGCLVGGRGNVVPVICGFGAGQSNKIYSDYSTSFGYNNLINKNAPYSNTLGINNVINGYGATAIGRGLIASRDYQIVLGLYNKEDTENILVIGGGSSEGGGSNEVRKNILMIDENGTLQVPKLIVDGNELANITKGASGTCIAGGNGSVEGEYAISLGFECESLQHHCFSTGLRAKSDGYAAISIGTDSKATADYAVSIGRGTVSSGQDQHVRGRFNEEMDVDYIDIVGNGVDNSNRSNAYTLKKNGDAWFAGDVKAGDISLTQLYEEIQTLKNQLANINNTTE